MCKDSLSKLHVQPEPVDFSYILTVEEVDKIWDSECMLPVRSRLVIILTIFYKIIRVINSVQIKKKEEDYYQHFQSEGQTSKTSYTKRRLEAEETKKFMKLNTRGLMLNSLKPYINQDK